MQKLQNLPIGKSSFESIRKKNDLYVDKTRRIFQMVDEGEFYFMSRPRRFGKSLTVSTLKCLFDGKKDLFKGLWVSENADWEWKEHPVVLIDFNSIPRTGPDVLTRGISIRLNQTARDHGIVLRTEFIETQFQELIVGLRHKHNSNVVVLVDEYDKPIIDHLGKRTEFIEIAKQNRDIMKSFFGVLKDADVMACLRFVFLTGVSKFSRVSIFSELNNLNDITMNRKYGDMMGYTQQELENSFSDHIARFAEETGQTPNRIMETLRIHYDGYRFSEKDIRVYNPFSVLRALEEKAFKNYWFETGTPAFLVNLLKEARWYLPKIENLKAGEGVFGTYDLDHLKPEALLFQTGYVTITDVRDRLYTFNYPNQEVKTSFLEMLFHSYTEGLPESSSFLLLSGYLQQEKFDAFFETVTSIFASIPYTLETKRDEVYFHTVFYLMLCASGANGLSEVLTCKGRIDLLINFPDKIFIIEFKCDRCEDAAMKQIREKGYADPYRSQGKKIILMGINFDTEKRTVAEWKVE